MMRIRINRAKLVGLGASFATIVFAQAAPVPVADSKQTYIDRVMDGSTLPEDGLELKASSYNASGWPRSLRVDYSLFTQKGGSDTQTHAVAVRGFLDTPDYGALSVNANLVERQANVFANLPQNRSSTWRIDQRGLALDGAWRANHSAGDINTGLAPLARSLRRVSIPTTQLRGASGQWFLGDSVDMNAAVGRTGLFSGLDVAGFETSGGQIATAGGQFRLPLSSTSGRSDAAFQLIKGRNIPDSGGTGSKHDTHAFWASTAWEGLAPWSHELAAGSVPPGERQGGLRVQGNVVHSNGTRDGGASGVWADATWRTERWRNTAGLFRFEPNLRWGTAMLASDLQGVYWQAETATRQWQSGFAAELSDRVSGAGSGTGAPGRSAFFMVNGRYRLDIRNSIGATLSLRTFTSPGQALLLTWDRASDLGQTQWRSDFANTADSRTTRFGVDHSWSVLAPASFNTSLAWERVAGGVSPTMGLIWGLLGSVSPLSQWTVDAALRGAQRSDASKSVNANIGLGWQPYGGWSLALRYTEARGQEPLPALVVSALTTASLPALITTPANRSLQLVLRYEASAGTASAPLGGLSGTGAGSLRGSVFFDADANGRREASEAGVPSVTVILDRRYVTRTDAQGHYEFPAVAAGEHLIEVSSDNVPLPWSPTLRDPIMTRVLVRQTTTLDFAVQRNP